MAGTRATGTTSGTTSGKGPRSTSREQVVRGAALSAAHQEQFTLDLPVDTRRGYRGPAVCDIVGITYRQLDYWARTGLVPASIRSASGSGTQRLYAFEDIVRLRVVRRLLDAGVTLERIRAALDALASQGRTLADVTLASDGRTVYAIDDDRQLLDLLRGGQGVFAIALEPLVEELRGEVSLLPSSASVLEDDGDASTSTVAV
jgi:DNA-binding transcriptional MerR regulator